MPWGRTPISSRTGTLSKAQTEPEVPWGSFESLPFERSAEPHQSKLQPLSARALSITDFPQTALLQNKKEYQMDHIWQ